MEEGVGMAEWLYDQTSVIGLLKGFAVSRSLKYLE